jgi:hypothetical protein
MTKENSNAVKNAILIAAAEKLIDFNFSIDLEELPERASKLFEDFMLTDFSNDMQTRVTAHEVLTVIRDFSNLMTVTNHELAQNV